MFKVILIKYLTALSTCFDIIQITGGANHVGWTYTDFLQADINILFKIEQNKYETRGSV